MAQGHRRVPPLFPGGLPSAGVGWARFPVRRHEAGDFAGPGRRQPRQHIRQVLQGIDAATPEAHQDRVDHGTAPARVRVPDEEPPLSAYCGRPYRVFDEVLLTTLRQRELREKLVLRMISIPVPPRNLGEITDAFARAVTPKTRAILVSHVVNLTGQITPVKEICELARPKGIEVIVDGAHSFAHFDFKQGDIGCGYYGTSLHKWLFAPKGTGLLYVRRDKIPKIWPLMAAEAKYPVSKVHPGLDGARPSARAAGLGRATLSWCRPGAVPSSQAGDWGDRSSWPPAVDRGRPSGIPAG